MSTFASQNRWEALLTFLTFITINKGCCNLVMYISLMWNGQHDLRGLKFMLNYDKRKDRPLTECKNVNLFLGLNECGSHVRRTMGETWDRLLTVFWFLLILTRNCSASLIIDRGWHKPLAHLMVFFSYIVTVNPEGDDLFENYFNRWHQIPRINTVF